jgi:hypothetical protein
LIDQARRAAEETNAENAATAEESIVAEITNAAMAANASEGPIAPTKAATQIAKAAQAFAVAQDIKQTINTVVEETIEETINGAVSAVRVVGLEFATQSSLELNETWKNMIHSVAQDRHLKLRSRLIGAANEAVSSTEKKVYIKFHHSGEVHGYAFNSWDKSERAHIQF